MSEENHRIWGVLSARPPLAISAIGLLPLFYSFLNRISPCSVYKLFTARANTVSSESDLFDRL